MYSKQKWGAEALCSISYASPERPAKRSSQAQAAYDSNSPASLTVAMQRQCKKQRATIKNDPSAGSPTETLLRLLVPPVDQVCHSSSLNF